MCIEMQDGVIKRINELRQVNATMTEASLKQSGLFCDGNTHLWAKILMRLEECDEKTCPLKEFQEDRSLCIKQKNTALKYLTPMEECGFIKIFQDADNPKRTMIQMTEDGRDALYHCKQRYGEMVKRLFSHLSSIEIEQMLDSLDEMHYRAKEAGLTHVD